MGKKVMLQHPTQCSGIIAVHPVQNSDSGAASLRVSSRQRVFAAPHDGSACTFVTRLFAPIWTASGDSSLRFAVFVPSPSLTFFFTFVVFFAARPLFCSELKVFDDGLRCQAKVASPTAAPRIFGCSSGQPKARPSGARNASSSANLRACERARTS